MKLIINVFRSPASFFNTFRKYGVFSEPWYLKDKHNLQKQPIFFGSRYFASAPKDILSEKSVKIFLEHASKVYEGKEIDKCEITSILELREIGILVEERLQMIENIQSLHDLVRDDKEMKLLSEEEFTAYEMSLNDLDERLLNAISSHLGREYRNDIVLEISAGVGGQEAMLFANDLLEMYMKHLAYLGYIFTLVEKDLTSQGGIRHASLTISGRGAYEKFRHEGGVHRVQRIPSTETSGRIHTSVVSVAILPQPNEIEVSLKSKDLKVETKKATGAGGQHVNTTDSAVRIVHIPTGIAAECQTQRSQTQNKQLALLKLRTRIYEKILNEQVSNTKEIRKKQVGFKGRNERIRTYNFLQDRITDHRIQNGTIHGLREFMEGGAELDELQEKLQAHFQRKILIETIEEVEKERK